MHKYMLGFHFVYSCQRCNSFIHKSSVPPPQPRFFCDACSSGTTLLTYSATKSKCPFELHIWSIEYDGHRHFSLSSNGSGSWLLATSATGIARNSSDMSLCNFFYLHLYCNPSLPPTTNTSAILIDFSLLTIIMTILFWCLWENKKQIRCNFLLCRMQVYSPIQVVISDVCSLWLTYGFVYYHNIEREAENW